MFLFVDPTSLSRQTDGVSAVRKATNLRELGLPQNVFVWSAKDVGTWLTSLGLGEYAPAFESNKLQGDVIFLLLESHLVDMGMRRIGDRLYFMEACRSAAVVQWYTCVFDKVTSPVREGAPPLQRTTAHVSDPSAACAVSCILLLPTYLQFVIFCRYSPSCMM